MMTKVILLLCTTGKATAKVRIWMVESQPPAEVESRFVILRQEGPQIELSGPCKQCLIKKLPFLTPVLNGEAFFVEK